MAGFLSKLFGGGNSTREVSELVPDVTSHPRTEVAIPHHEDLEVSGESYHRAGIGTIFQTLGRSEGGVTMQVAHLVPDPKNEYDKNAVRVVVLGQQVGHVPQESSAKIARACASVGRGNVATVLARIWARNDDGVWRSRVTLMFSGARETEKDYAKERIENEVRIREWEAESARKASEKAAREAEREARRNAGSIDGQYWPLLKPSIAELKRQKRFEEARDILEKCIDAAESESKAVGSIPDSWPTEQMSVVLRRLKEYAQELAYLERYVLFCGDSEAPESVIARLNRSRLTAERAGTSK